MKPIQLDGMTGQNYSEMHQATERWADQHPGATKDQIQAAIKRNLAVYTALFTYNLLRRELAHEAAARQERDQALELVEERWEELSTAANFCAHHAYSQAVDEARTALDRWADAAEMAAKIGGWSDPAATEVYRTRILAAGHPEVQPLSWKAINQERKERHTALEQQHKHRTALLTKNRAS